MDDASGKTNEPKDQWTVGDRLQAISIIGGLLISLVSLCLSVMANKSSSQAARAVDIARVETGDATTNSNDGDYSNPWTPWFGAFSQRTSFIGLQRKVTFVRPFTSVPDVTTALEGFDTKPPSNILTALAYPATDKITAERLRHISIITAADNKTTAGFMLQVAIGLPPKPEEFMTKAFSGRLADDSEGLSDDALILLMLQDRQLSDRTEGKRTLSQNELWMVNFYKAIGSISVSWVAQSREKTAPSIPKGEEGH
jgi:hypothetical protein